MTEEEYRKIFALNQSALKEWKDISPSKWYNRWVLGIKPKQISEAIDFGNLLDTLCFSEKLFTKRFIISEIKKPSETLVKIVTNVYEHIKELNIATKEINKKENLNIPQKEYSLIENKEIVLKFCKENEYYVSKPEQAYNTVLDKGSEYFNFLQKTGTKIVITPEQYELAKELKEILYNDPVCAGFFNPKKGCEVFFQVQIFTDFLIENENIEGIDSLPIKGMLDIIHVNNKKKEVREVDLKFTTSAFAFNDYTGPVKRFRYALQHSFYRNLLVKWLETFKEGKYKDYTISNSINVVIDDEEKIPYVYEYDHSLLDIERDGHEQARIKGWIETIYEIAYHMSIDNWKYPIEHIQKGKICINNFKK